MEALRRGNSKWQTEIREAVTGIRHTYASSGFMISPWMSVRRKSRPW
jgi:hypothetical protein